MTHWLQSSVRDDGEPHLSIRHLLLKSIRHGRRDERLLSYDLSQQEFRVLICQKITRIIIFMMINAPLSKTIIPPWEVPVNRRYEPARPQE